jgi:hypothetical protein
MVYIAVSRKVAVDYLRVGAEVWMYLVRAAVPSGCTSLVQLYFVDVPRKCSYI